MRFKRSAYISVLALSAGFAWNASADDSATVNGITFYGSIDVGVTYDTHGVPASGYSSTGENHLIGNTSNKATWNFTQSNLGQSFIGLKGADDLGDGWTGLFKLETGVNPAGGNITDGLKAQTNNNGKANNIRTASNDSSMAGEAFNRGAYVGISNDKYGTLTAGRQNTLMADQVSAYDPAYSSYAFSLIGTSSVYAGGGSAEDARWDNSVKYLYATGPARLGLEYQFGGSIARNDNGEAADIGFDWAGLSVDGVYVHKKDLVAASALGTSGATSLATATAAGYDATNTYSLAAKYTYDAFKFYGAYEYIKSSNPSSPLFTGAIDIGGYALFAPTNNAFTHNRIYDVLWGGVRYKATSKLELTAAYYYVHQNAYATGATTGCDDTRATNCSGETHAASLSAVYSVSKRFQAYGGVMYSQVLNGMASGYFHNNNLSPTVGLRYSF
jgi:predicted porin